MTPSTATATATAQTARKRVPASERREALIESAVHEFAQGGLHGTPVDRIARRVGVAQPYVFALFGSKRELFLAAVERGFNLIADVFTQAAQAYDPVTSTEPDVLKAMGSAYIELLSQNRDYLMLQHQSYAACEDPVIRDRVRQLYAELMRHAQALSSAEPERLDDFFRYGMWLNVAAAMGVEDLSVASDWVRAERSD
jgi:AcrR family transcriptional regulator